uniref:Uncharacterized protein n=1 Tax=Nelumbo nucifera TaxID=4432 RepID=A0A822Z5N0_NELNU|nr:TPA_asm: hypothetical protein HUJ06_016017 [Nelumbo nucifera]
MYIGCGLMVIFLISIDIDILLLVTCQHFIDVREIINLQYKDTSRTQPFTTTNSFPLPNPSE